MKVTFAWRYRSDAGSWNQGDVADLPADLVDWLNRDSPGVCVPVVEGEAPAPGWTGQSPNNRMVTNAQKRDPKAEDPKQPESDEGSGEEPEAESEGGEGSEAEEGEKTEESGDSEADSERRQDREGDPSDQGPITRADRKATKNKGD